MTIRRQLVRLVAASVLPAALGTSLLIVYAHDRRDLEGDVFVLSDASSQQLVNTQRLGLRRVGITEAANKLRKASLVKKSCECYRFIRGEYESLHGEVPRLLSRE